jgi:hypothetical protein
MSDETTRRDAPRRFAVCINNEGSEASLERNKIYVVLPDERADADGLIRVVDEDGEDYLYPKNCIEPVKVSKAIESSLLRAS